MRADATSTAGSYAQAVVSGDDLRRVIAANVMDIRALTATPDGRELAVAVRGDSNKSDQVVRVALPDGPGRAEVSPLFLDVPEIGALVYSDTGDLFLAEKSSNAWSVIRVPAGGTSRQAETLIELPAAGNEVIAVNARGVLTKTSAASIEWRDFSPPATVQYGEATDARITKDSRKVALIAPDRRGNAQLWLASRDNPAERKQLTFLSAGLGTGLALSNDGRYAACVAPLAETPNLILVNLESAGKN